MTTTEAQAYGRRVKREARRRAGPRARFLAGFLVFGNIFTRISSPATFLAGFLVYRLINDQPTRHQQVVFIGLKPKTRRLLMPLIVPHRMITGTAEQPSRPTCHVTVIPMAARILQWGARRKINLTDSAPTTLKIEVGLERAIRPTVLSTRRDPSGIL